MKNQITVLKAEKVGMERKHGRVLKRAHGESAARGESKHGGKASIGEKHIKDNKPKKSAEY
jgi:hypothetical protein